MPDKHPNADDNNELSGTDFTDFGSVCRKATLIDQNEPLPTLEAARFRGEPLDYYTRDFDFVTSDNHRHI